MIRPLDHLIRTLERIDGRGYGEYKQVKGEFDAELFRLLIDWVQGDPYAAPSRVRAVLTGSATGLPEWTGRDRVRRRATGDYLNRVFHHELRRCSVDRGSGRSGEMVVLRPGQEILDRTSVLVSPDGGVEARFRVGLPARGRRILGRQAVRMLTQDLPDAIDNALRFESLDADALRRHVETTEDAVALRGELSRHGLVGFVADGAILPRRSGIDDRPLETNNAIPFESPPSLRVTLNSPNAGPVSGMGLREGVTLIVGGGYHGKSTLLRALERGIYDHVPRDGREQTVTVPGAVKVRAEDGRRVAGTDISNFIGRLPGGTETTRFFTDNASGSTSQAAAIAEALEMGARCLLIDEDTSATNFMIRDGRMQQLVASEHEPITPFIDRAQQLYRELGVSTILVVGGSGDYFDVADTVIAMRDYTPQEVTADARRIASDHPSTRRAEGGSWQPIGPRVPLPESLDPARGRKQVSIKTPTEERVVFGTEEVDLSAVEQIVELAQTRAMAEAIAWGRGRVIDGRRSMTAAMSAIVQAIEAGGLDAIHPDPLGELAEFRIYELAAVVNRIRSFDTEKGHVDAR